MDEIELIPVANPRAAYLAQKDEIDAAIARVFASSSYILGPEVAAFEDEFAAWIGPGMHAIGCGSGTDALVLALRALGIGPGYTVVAPSFTAVATAAAIQMVGATPLLLDVAFPSLTLNPRELERVLTDRTRYTPLISAVIAVHLYGGAADIEAIKEICRRHDVLLIEDCAQAHGATLHGRKLGTFGDVATFSFYPTKNLGALGDGGAVVVDSPVLAGRLRQLRQYGWDAERSSLRPGINSRLDEIQAAILRVKLAALDQKIQRRQEIAAAYDEASRAIVSEERPDSTHAYHLYILRTNRRDRLRDEFLTAGIATGIHYPLAVHQQGAYRHTSLGPSLCVRSEEAAATVLSVPLWPEMTDAQVERVCTALRGL